MNNSPTDSPLPQTVSGAHPVTSADTTLAPLASYPPSRLLSEPAPTFPIPFGHYILQGILGTGAMGVVYQAHDPRLKRTVALKRIALGKLNRPESAAMFRVEAQAAAQFDHRHIVTILDVGEEAGELYFTMALVGGGTLAEARPKLLGDAPAAVALMAKVAHAVAYAHAKQIIHRDLKPQNILLDEQGEPRVSDFGLAKILGGSAWDDEGIRLGTPGYMSPEQARGETGRVGPASDVWALGVILYELLTGQQPFRANNRETLTQLICTREPMPFADLTPGLPADLERIVSRCLAKDPVERYPSAAELAADLDAWLVPVPSPAEVTPRRPWRWVGVGAGMLALAGLVALGVWMTPTAEQREKARLVKQFNKGEEVTLVGEAGAPAWYRFRTQADRKPLQVFPPNPLRLLADEPLLVELFPNALQTGFRFSAEVLQDSSFDGGIGVYFGHREIAKGPNAGHWFWAIQFNDLGNTAKRADLVAYYYRPADSERKRLITTFARVQKQLPEKQGAWRPLVVEVTQQGVTATLDGVTWSYTHAQLEELARPPHPLVVKQVNPMPHRESPADGWGHVGLFVFRGEARYRNVTLELIPSPVKAKE